MMSTTHERPSPFPDPATARGQIQVIFGPMFSGKSTELLRRMRRYKLANYKCLVIKYAKDTRYDLNGVATHDKQTLDAVPATDLLSLTSLAANSDVVGIDEGQFFPDVVEFCDRMAELGKIVIVAALDGTFQKVGFGKILELVPLAESVVKLTAVCMRCYQDASFTKRIGQETQVEVIGGADKYLAVCRNCFLSPKKTTKENPPNFTNLNKNTSSTRKIFDSKTSDDKENTPILSDFSVDTKFSRKLFSTPNRLNLPS